MPYIPQKDRNRFRGPLALLENEIDTGGLSNGDLNYLITTLARFYLNKHGMSYNTLSDVVKALECAKLEFYRRIVSPYEDYKIRENGDMWPGGEVE